MNEHRVRKIAWLLALSAATLVFVGLLLLGCGSGSRTTEINLRWGETATYDGLSVRAGRPVHKTGATFGGEERWEGSFAVVIGDEPVPFSVNDFDVLDASGRAYQPAGAPPRLPPEIPTISVRTATREAGSKESNEHAPVWYLPPGIEPVAVVYVPSWTQSWKVTWR